MSLWWNNPKESAKEAKAVTEDTEGGPVLLSDILTKTEAENRHRLPHDVPPVHI